MNMFAKFLARQLSHPSGIFGRLVLASLWNKRNAALNDVVFDNLALQPHDRVLEVGFGGGYLLGRMATIVTEGLLAGVDVSAAMVTFCERRYRLLVKTGKLELKCAKAEALPYAADYFTKVCTVNSIFYWENAPQVIAECYRVLKEDGLLVLCFTDKKSLAPKEFTHHGVALYEADEVHQMLASAGFQGIEKPRSRDKYREFWCLKGKKSISTGS
jgi:ubiquinone/menaquinone biosynthesis C-methylase UbiE